MRSFGRLGLMAALVPTFSVRQAGIPPDGNVWIDVHGSLHIGAVMVALVVVFLSWLLDEARKLQADQDLVI